MRLPAAALDHRRFWDAMDAVSETELKEIERRIVARMIESFGVDLSGLVLDMTNFATYIDSGNPRAPIAQRGHAKQKRNDLRLVGLGLVVSTDGGIPLLSHAYPGNKPDVTQFPEMLKELVARFGALGGDASELTLVFDAGQNSDDNFELLEGSPLHFVGSLPPSDHQELLAVGKDRYEVVDEERFPGLMAFETRKVVFGVERRVVVTHSDNLHDKQSQGFDQTLGKAGRQLVELATRLARGKTRRSRDKVEAEIETILKPRWCSRVISTSLAGESPAELRLRCRTSAKARELLEEECFGKRILFSDKDDDLTSVIVADYRSLDCLGAGVPVDLGQLVLCAREAYLQPFNLAEPALALGLDDAGGEVLADLCQAGSLGWIGPEHRAADTGVLVDARGAKSAGAGPDRHLAPLEVAEELLPFLVGRRAVLLARRRARRRARNSRCAWIASSG